MQKPTHASTSLCLGLLRMVIYTIEARLKEVGIRKILGASESNIHWILAKGFLLSVPFVFLLEIFGYKILYYAPRLVFECC